MCPAGTRSRTPAPDAPYTSDSWPPCPMPAGDYAYHVLLAHDGAKGLAVATRLRDDLGRRGVSAWYEDASQARACARWRFAWRHADFTFGAAPRGGGGCLR